MKHRTKLLMTLCLSALLITGCGSSGSDTAAKDLELQKKELELKEKELELREKELTLKETGKQSGADAAQSAGTGTANPSGETQTTATTTASSSAANYTTITDFWREFKKAATKKNYQRISQLTYFPFLKQTKYIYKEDFAKFTFTESNIKAIAKAKTPVRSLMAFDGGLDNKGKQVKTGFVQGQVYEVKLGGARIFFAKSAGSFKFIAIISGE